MSGYESLKYWQESMNLVEKNYEITKKLPSEEKFGLISQMRRASVSIPTNIAEGHDRSTTAQYVHFLYIARGSCSELETLLTLCKRLYKNEDFDKLYLELLGIHRKIIAATRTLEAKSSPVPGPRSPAPLLEVL